MWEGLIHIMVYPQAMMVMKEWLKTKTHGVPYHYNIQIWSMQNKWLSWDMVEAGQVLSLPVGCQLRGLALSASDKLRVTTLDFAGQRGSVFPLDMQHGTVYFLERRNSARLGRGCVCVCMCFVEVEGWYEEVLSLWFVYMLLYQDFSFVFYAYCSFSTCYCNVTSLLL